MQLRITRINNLSDQIWQIDLTGEFPYAQVQAGQFVNILIGSGTEHVLRRPISIAEVDVAKASLTIVFRVVGDGTKWLSQQQVGDYLDIIGPLGTGYQLPFLDAKVLVVGGGIGIPPLYQLTKELSLLTDHIQIVLGFRSQEECFWLERFAELGQLTVTTEDGSYGTTGFVTEVLGSFKQYDFLYSCGPRGMLRALKQQFQSTDVQGYVSLEENMACGVGACYGCVCTAAEKQQNYRICQEGPVFHWEDVLL